MQHLYPEGFRILCVTPAHAEVMWQSLSSHLSFVWLRTCMSCPCIYDSGRWWVLRLFGIDLICCCDLHPELMECWVLAFLFLDFRFHAFSLLVVIQAVIRCFTGFFCDMLYSVSPFVCCEWYLTLRLGDWRVRDFLLRTDTLSPTRLVMHWRFIRMIAFFVDECDLVLSGCTFWNTVLPRSHITASQTLKLYWLGLLLRFRAGVSAPCAVTPSSTTPTKKSFR